MAAQFKISIPKPCHEQWTGMMHDENGKFCGACQKSVIDFTQFSDSDIIRWFEKNQGESCGRFSVHQLDRHLYAGEKSTFQLFKPGLAAASLMLMLGFAKQSSAQSLNAVSETYQTDRKATSHDSYLNLDSVTVLKGKVVDTLGHGISGVIITLKNSDEKAQTDTDGKFSFIFNANRNKEIVELEIKAIGYESKSTTALIGEDNLVFNLKEDMKIYMLGGAIAGGIMVKRSFFGNILYNIKKIF